MLAGKGQRTAYGDDDRQAWGDGPWGRQTPPPGRAPALATLRRPQGAPRIMQKPAPTVREDHPAAGGYGQRLVRCRQPLANPCSPHTTEC
jgi:hypothetical protein